MRLSNTQKEELYRKSELLDEVILAAKCVIDGISLSQTNEDMQHDHLMLFQFALNVARLDGDTEYQ